MSYRVILQPRAERELLAAARWLEGQSQSTAKALRWVRSVRTKIESLRANPERCPIDPDSDVYGETVRVLIFGKRHSKYRILFAVRGDAVHVVSVRHSARRSLAEELEGDDAEEEPLH